MIGYEHYLLLATIGAIALMWRHSTGPKRQHVRVQKEHNLANGLDIYKEKPGQGL